MTDLANYYGFRDQLTDAVIRDIVGPGRADQPRPDENILSEAPMNRYISGVLYPPTSDRIDEIEDNELENIREIDQDDQFDRPVAMANVRYPSAMGITCCVDAGVTDTVNATVTTARYLPIEAGDDELERWERHPLRLSHEIRLQRQRHDSDYPLGHGLQLYVREREPNADNLSTLTVALVNKLTMPADEWRRDRYSFFQVELDLSTHNQGAFVDRTGTDFSGVDDDARSFALLYRDSPTFATGHGCGAEWDISADANAGHVNTARASRVRTSVTPSYELLLADNNPDIASPYFSMRRLAADSRTDVVEGLNSFLNGYRDWISTQAARVDSLGDDFGQTARRHLQECETAASRIADGIALLAADEQAWLAFQLMNEAMHIQRARSEWSKDRLQDAPFMEGDAHCWHAFQLGFILMVLRGIAEPESSDRAIVDLLWFPTGGGKTEAYLGLIAFTIFFRRLRANSDDRTGAGMAVIMRYTLRLLTLQQYQRAALLICACEFIRQQRDDLGADEISICLWVGRAATPLDLAATRSALEEIRGGASLEEENPIQLRECPWCTQPLSHRNYWVADHRPRLVIACRNKSCDFEDGVPCYLVDEDVYRLRPSLMIATVDKFASLPWQDKIGSMFNVDSVEDPPELIIQDELHLISGPLGTMVGLYETAINMLCTRDGVGPKIIASTATIRRAEQQIQKLYASDSFQFPPPGLDAGDSYFAVERSKNAKGTRRYLGLIAPGTSHATLLVRAYAAALQNAERLDGAADTKDPYWTVLGYFNSLRVLGAARMQIRDDVCDRIELLANLADTKVRPLSERLDRLVEMTSRVKSSEIPQNLERMGLKNDDDDCPDVVLATNMISVGVDVDRLGLMILMGQPQSTSEYIQATSRVGRRFPGIVFVLFNSSRSRDRSHYEDFIAFHGSLYRQVDASSVTPFAARARDRALHAVFVGLMRARYREYRENASAADVENLEQLSEPIVCEILERVEQIEPSEPSATEMSLRRLISDWKKRAAETEKLMFRNRRHPELALLSDASRPDIAERHDTLPTMWSLRAVDTESNLFLVSN